MDDKNITLPTMGTKNDFNMMTFELNNMAQAY